LKTSPLDSGSQGTAFAQKGGKPKKGDDKKSSDKGKRDKKDFDKENFKDKPCFKCRKKGHPQSHCPAKDNDDDSSISSKSSKGSKSGSSKPKLKEFENLVKSLKKSFAQLKSAQEEYSDSDSSEEMLHFQFDSGIRKKDLPAPESAYLTFKQFKKGLGKEFDLREVILLDNQSTVDIFCNKKFVNNIRLAPEPLTLKSNGGKLVIYHIADITNYKEPVWFSKKAIANIFSLKIMKRQYRVTYDSSDESFLVQ
jgi:hypothetical protein